MTSRDSIAELVEILRRKAPEYLDLMTATSEDEFEKAFIVLLERAVSHLERNKKNYATLKEEGLSGVLTAALTMPGLTVHQEANSNGHVDLTIVADHCRPTMIKLGEAKIYSGPSYHIKGITQLLQRYTTGRETAGLLLNYVRDVDIKGVTTKLRAALDSELPENQTGPCADHTLKWSLATKHKHSSGEELALSHIGCNLYL